MRLVHRIILSVLVPMILTLGLWGWLSFRTMERKIHSINVEYPESSIYLHEEILIEHVLLWTILLFAVLLVCVVAVGVIVITSLLTDATAPVKSRFLTVP